MTGLRLVLALLLVSVTQAFAYPVKVAEAPFNDLALTIQAIETAKKYLLVNIYDLSSPDVAAALIERIHAGVHVAILEEGQPVGGISYAGREIQAQLVKAMEQSGNDNHLFVMTSKNPDGTHRRFRFDHAKYIVADGENLLIGSENYSPTGNPTPGKLGNRGWEVFINSQEVANFFGGLFANDATTKIGDVIELTASSGAHPFEAPVVIGDLEQLKAIARGLPVYESNSIVPVLSPDNSEGRLVQLIASAQTSIDLEQMTVDSQWGSADAKSPLVVGIVAAARRGVKVRVLANDETVFDRPNSKPGRRKNQQTVDLLNGIAQKENLQMEARIADVQAMGVDYIHNKGALIDGHLTLVSSINWDLTSVEHNRESAVVLDSSDIAGHYGQLFDRDWQVSDGGHREY